MPAWLAPMRWIFRPVLQWIGSAGWHVQSRLILRLVTIAAFDREDALPISAAPKTEGFVGMAVFTLQRRIACGVTINAPGMAEDLERFHKSCSRLHIIA